MCKTLYSAVYCEYGVHLVSGTRKERGTKECQYVVDQDLDVGQCWDGKTDGGTTANAHVDMCDECKEIMNVGKSKHKLTSGN